MDLISRILELRDEYEYESNAYAGVSELMSEYYEGKAEALKEVIEMFNETVDEMLNEME